MTSLELPKLMSKSEVADLLRVSVRTVERMSAEEGWTRTRVGRFVRFHGSEIEKWLEGRTFRTGF